MNNPKPKKLFSLGFAFFNHDLLISNRGFCWDHKKEGDIKPPSSFYLFSKSDILEIVGISQNDQ